MARALVLAISFILPGADASRGFEPGLPKEPSA